ncbi:conserved hypothetical protein [Candidatus Desulfarcum epimagneticum]|uniref:4Fe-4S ferredoxin-type domain-containing protein n=1 Tax=uncultured Desulfobacteraceae bacterium TaxID=218296 RepID=A0A484HMT8_9BACT|nr:conserved hypothetical protein [uncultured Desulfobacteraceae bacterium]
MPYAIDKEKCIGCRMCTKVCPVTAIEGEVNKPHQIHPKICVDCGACGRICPQSAVKDPDGKFCERIRFRKRWPKPRFDLGACSGCSACVECCPTGCLDLSGERKGEEEEGPAIRYPFLKRARSCVACGFCVLECPVDAIEMAGAE